MKTITFIIIFLQIILVSKAQIFIDKKETHKFEISLCNNLTFAQFRDVDYETYYYFDDIFTPSIGFYPTQNIGVGLIFSFDVSGSNFMTIPFKKSYGVFTRLYFPKKINSKYFKKLDFFVEFNISVSNYYFSKDTPATFGTKNPNLLDLPPTFPSLNQKFISIPVGIKFQLTDRLFGEISYKYYYNFHEKGIVYPQLGLNYQFISNKTFKKIKRKIESKTEKHKDFLNTFIFGASFSYFDSGNVTLDNGDAYWATRKEFNFNVATSVNKKTFVGIQVINFSTNDINHEQGNFYLYGIFAQYNVLKYRPERKKRLFIEFSLNNSNFCSYADKNFTYIGNTAYAGIGMGFDIHLKRISKHLFLDIAGYYYLLLSNIKKGFSFPEYAIGLNYHFGKRVQEKWH